MKAAIIERPGVLIVKEIPLPQVGEVETGARWLGPPCQKQFQALYAFADELGMTLPELALRFVLSNPGRFVHVDGRAFGAGSGTERRCGEKGPLPDDVLDRLDDITAMAPFRPFEEPFGLPFGRNYRGPGVA